MAFSLAPVRDALYTTCQNAFGSAHSFSGTPICVSSLCRPYPPDDLQLPLDIAVDFSLFDIEDAHRECVRRACAEILRRASTINEKQPISIDGAHMSGFEYFATPICKYMSDVYNERLLLSEPQGNITGSMGACHVAVFTRGQPMYDVHVPL